MKLALLAQAFSFVTVLSFERVSKFRVHSITQLTLIFLKSIYDFENKD